MHTAEQESPLVSAHTEGNAQSLESRGLSGNQNIAPPEPGRQELSFDAKEKARLELYRDFLWNPSHGLGADILYEVLGPAEMGYREVYEPISVDRGIFYHRHPGKPYFEIDAGIRYRTRRILEKAITKAFSAKLIDSGMRHELEKAHRRALKAARSSDFVSSTLRLFSDRIAVPGIQWNATKEALCLLDGVIDFSGNKLFRRGPRKGEFWRDPINLTCAEVLNPGEAPYWHSILENLFSGNPDTRLTLLQTLALGISGRTQRTFTVWFNPFGANGKNLLVDIIQSVLGKSACGLLAGDLVLKNGDSSVRRFGRGELEGLRLGFIDEVYGTFDISEIKSLTGGSFLRVERKGRDPKLIAPTFNIIALTNKLPAFAPADDIAFLDRLILVPFTTVFYTDEEDRKLKIAAGVPEGVLRQGKPRDTLMEAIQPERGAILHHLIQIYMEMRNSYGGRPYPSINCQKAKLAYRDENDTAGEFIKTYFTIDDGGRVEITRITELWSEFTGDKKITARKLSKLLREKLPGTETRAIHGKRYIYGIREKGSTDYEASGNFPGTKLNFQCHSARVPDETRDENPKGTEPAPGHPGTIILI